MKIFILLALVGVSLCHGFDGFPQPPVGYGSSYESFGQGGIIWDGSNGWGNGGSGGHTGGSGGGKGGFGGLTGGSEGGKGGFGGQTGKPHFGGSGGHDWEPSSEEHDEGSWNNNGGSKGHVWGSTSSDHDGSSSSGSSWEFECSSNEKLSDDKNCVERALQIAPNLMILGQQILCAFYNHQEDMTDEFYDSFKTDFTGFMRCVGCGLGSVVGLEEVLGNVGGSVGGVVGDLLPALDHLKGLLGIKRLVHDPVCLLLGGLLSSECAHQFISVGITGLSENLRTAMCSDDKDLDTEQMTELLRQFGCMVDATVGFEDVMENFTENTAKALAPAVKNVVGMLKEVPLAGGTLCGLLGTVDNLLTGGDGRNGGILNGLNLGIGL